MMDLNSLFSYEVMCEITVKLTYNYSFLFLCAKVKMICLCIANKKRDGARRILYLCMLRFATHFDFMLIIGNLMFMLWF